MAKSVSEMTRVQLGRTLAGAVVGGVATALVLAGLDRLEVDLDDPTTMIAVAAGLIYALIGLAVGFGALAPRTGARFLNVEDEEELREQRRSLGPSAVATMLFGLFLLVLAVGPTYAGLLGPATVATLAVAILAAAVIVGLATRRRTDEMMRQVSTEASALTLHVGCLAIAVWASFAHLGLVGWADPLAFVAGLALLQLATIFAVCARKGLLHPR